MTTLAVIGQLAADPELAYTRKGTPYANLTVLENQRIQDDQGNWTDKEPPNRFRVKVWGDQAEHVANSLIKGDRVLVVGQWRTDKYSDRETGQDRFTSYIAADEIGPSLRWTDAGPARNRAAQAGDPTPQHDEPTLPPISAPRPTYTRDDPRYNPILDEPEEEPVPPSTSTHGFQPDQANPWTQTPPAPFAPWHQE